MTNLDRPDPPPMANYDYEPQKPNGFYKLLVKIAIAFVIIVTILIIQVSN